MRAHSPFPTIDFFWNTLVALFGNSQASTNTSEQPEEAKVLPAADVQVQSTPIAKARIFDYTIDPAPPIRNPWDSPDYIPFDDPLVENRKQPEF